MFTWLVKATNPLFYLYLTQRVMSDCVATYETNGSLNIPCVTVDTAMYQADMKLIPSSNPVSFELTGAKPTEGISTTDSCVATYQIDGELSIPCVTVPSASGGTVMYRANMALIPSSNPFTFKLTQAQLKN